MTQTVQAVMRSAICCRNADDLQPPHHPLHPLLPDVGVNLGGGDGLMAEQRLDIHQFGPGVEQVGGVSMPQLVRADLCLLYTSPSPRDRTRSRMPSSA